MEKWSDPPLSYFIEKVHNFWTQKKCLKAMDWPRPPTPLSEKFRKKAALFFRMASLSWHNAPPDSNELAQCSL